MVLTEGGDGDLIVASGLLEMEWWRLPVGVVYVMLEQPNGVCSRMASLEDVLRRLRTDLRPMVWGGPLLTHPWYGHTRWCGDVVQELERFPQQDGAGSWSWCGRMCIWNDAGGGQWPPWGCDLPVWFHSPVCCSRSIMMIDPMVKNSGCSGGWWTMTSMVVLMAWCDLPVWFRSPVCCSSSIMMIDPMVKNSGCSGRWWTMTSMVVLMA